MDAIGTMLVTTEIADKEPTTVLVSCNSVLNSVEALLKLIESVPNVRMREILDVSNVRFRSILMYTPPSSWPLRLSKCVMGRYLLHILKLPAFDRS